MAKEITDNYARVLKHRFKKNKCLNIDLFKQLINSGKLSEKEKKEIGEKHILLLKKEILKTMSLIK